MWKSNIEKWINGIHVSLTYINRNTNKFEKSKNQLSEYIYNLPKYIEIYRKFLSRKIKIINNNNYEQNIQNPLYKKIFK